MQQHTAIYKLNFIYLCDRKTDSSVLRDGPVKSLEPAPFRKMHFYGFCLVDSYLLWLCNGAWH